MTIDEQNLLDSRKCPECAKRGIDSDLRDVGRPIGSPPSALDNLKCGKCDHEYSVAYKR